MRKFLGTIVIILLIIGILGGGVFAYEAKSGETVKGGIESVFSTVGKWFDDLFNKIKPDPDTNPDPETASYMLLEKSPNYSGETYSGDIGSLLKISQQTERYVLPAGQSWDDMHLARITGVSEFEPVTKNQIKGYELNQSVRCVYYRFAVQYLKTGTYSFNFGFNDVVKDDYMYSFYKDKMKFITALNTQFSYAPIHVSDFHGTMFDGYYTFNSVFYNLQRTAGTTEYIYFAWEFDLGTSFDVPITGPVFMPDTISLQLYSAVFS